jgi:hypothetical protein
VGGILDVVLEGFARNRISLEYIGRDSLVANITHRECLGSTG